MESLTVGLIAASATVIAALIAGIYSYVNLLNSKEAKISEFRQKWIDELRDDISLFYSSSMSILAIFDVYKDKINQNDVKAVQLFIKDTKDAHGALVRSFSKIKLRINIKSPPLDLEDKSESKLIASLEKVRSKLRAVNENVNGVNYNDLKAEIAVEFDEFNKIANHVLKYHWERVKTGEPGYLHAKKFAISVFVGGLCLICLGLSGLFYFKYFYKIEAMSCYFESNKYDLNVSSSNKIYELSKNRGFNGKIILLSAHTDTKGENNCNECLASRRAKSVKSELMRLGVPENKIYINILGEKYLPINTQNNTDEIRNSVVEIDIK